jgi:hypothetical protein
MHDPISKPWLQLGRREFLAGTSVARGGTIMRLNDPALRATRKRLRVLVLASVVLGIPATTGAEATPPTEGSTGLKQVAGRELQSENLPRVASVVGGTGSDLAFWGKRAFAGDFNGFQVIDISRPRSPRALATVSCRGPQGDISVWRNLVFLSVERPQIQPRNKPVGACSSDAPSFTTPTSFEGIRIFDVRNPRKPRFLKGVPTDCGSHTHTLVPDLERGRVLLYVSSGPVAPDSPLGPHCGPGREENPLHAKFSIVSVPLGKPRTARVLSTPRIDVPVMDIRNVLPDSVPRVACHDISVFLELHLAAAACPTEAQLWDISDPANPKTLEPVRITDPPWFDSKTSSGTISYWHSATFTWDGKYVVFGDEYHASDGCHHSGTPLAGRLWIYAVANPTTPVGSFNIPRRQPPGQYCTVHEFAFIPVKDRYLLVSAWYEGGTSVIDFTDPGRPVEVAYSDLPGTNAWSAYWFDNSIYANGARGIDIFRLTEVGLPGVRRLTHLNPQTQETLLR